MAIIENKKSKREELRVTNPSKHLYDFVHKLAREGKRSVPKQVELIIDEHYKILNETNNIKTNKQNKMDTLRFPDGATQIDHFYFSSVEQKIEVVKRVPSNQVYASNPPQSAPDKVWKEIYGIKKGKLVLLETKSGKHIPRSINHERVVFEEEGK